MTFLQVQFTLPQIPSCSERSVSRARPCWLIQCRALDSVAYWSQGLNPGPPENKYHCSNKFNYRPNWGYYISCRISIRIVGVSTVRGYGLLRVYVALIRVGIKFNLIWSSIRWDFSLDDNNSMRCVCARVFLMPILLPVRHSRYCHTFHRCIWSTNQLVLTGSMLM